jgi:hypothetical protein
LRPFINSTPGSCILTIKDAHFAYVNQAIVAQSTTLPDALLEWRWAASYDPNGNIATIDFMGASSGHEDYLFNAIAPFVAHGSHIDMVGEDSRAWRWVFNNGLLYKQLGKVYFMGRRGGIDENLVSRIKEPFNDGASINQLIIEIIEWPYEGYSPIHLIAYFRSAFRLSLLEVKSLLVSPLQGSAKVDRLSLERGDFGDFADLRALIEDRIRAQCEVDVRDESA